MKTGEQILLNDMDVEVLNTAEDGLPKQTSFTFKAPLEDPSHKWLVWDWKKMTYESFELPAIGETVEIAGPF